MSRRGALVLGMHRSGTSAVTRMLSAMGLKASRPEDAVRGPWNPAGHFESRSLMTLDDRLLRDMGCTWWHPPGAGERYAEQEAAITVSVREARKVFRGAYPRRGWVWKDPRACLLLPFWRQVLGDDVVAVVVLRNPLDVARSLERRNRTTTGFGLALWERYNRLLLAHARGMPALVTRFDDLVDDPASWAEGAAEALGSLGLRLAASKAGRGAGDGVDAESRHSVHGRDELARLVPRALALYDALDAQVGVWPSWEPSVPDPEDPEVDRELGALGPETPPDWQPPPWVSERSTG